jgi:hypothetical protein
MTKNLSLGALAIGLLGIALGVYGANGGSLLIAGAILSSAGIIATAISEWQRPS